MELLFLTGLTGAGKSTVLPTLRDCGLDVLPDRRSITDRIILPAAQQLEGEVARQVSDRLERFRLTARYRNEYPDGIVHALRQELERSQQRGPAVFDGIRGEAEVRAALRRFPGSRFLMLLAAPALRVERLLSRGEAFDQAAGGPTKGGGTLLEELSEVEGAEEVLDLAALASRWKGEPNKAQDLLRAVRIVVEESRHYDEAGARGLLEQLPAGRRLIVDTADRDAVEVSKLVRSWL